MLNVQDNFASKIKKQNARQSTPGEGGQFTANKDLNQTKADLAKKNRIIKQEETLMKKQLLGMNLQMFAQTWDPDNVTVYEKKCY